MQLDYKKMLREIKSFVRRTGRISNNKKDIFAKNFKQFSLNCDNVPLNFTDVFGNNNPVILEIGFGMGESLFELAKTQTEYNFIGVEVHVPGVTNIIAKLSNEPLSNIKIINLDATEVLRNFIADNSLDQILILFPDPWHKTKHKKRRLIQQNFVDLISLKLKITGVLHCATDWQDYAEQMLAVLNVSKNLKNLSSDGEFIEKPLWRKVTKFENRGLKLGHKIFDLSFMRTV